MQISKLPCLGRQLLTIKFRIMSKKNEIQKCVISVEDCIVIHLEVGHTKEEWKQEKVEAAKGLVALWSFPVDELLDGTIEPDVDRIY